MIILYVYAELGKKELGKIRVRQMKYDVTARAERLGCRF